MAWVSFKAPLPSYEFDPIPWPCFECSCPLHYGVVLLVVAQPSGLTTASFLEYYAHTTVKKNQQQLDIFNK